MKKLLLVVILIVVLLSGCASDADVASQNVSKAADQFEIVRRIVFYNGITGEYILVIEGLCSLGNYDSGIINAYLLTAMSTGRDSLLRLSDEEKIAAISIIQSIAATEALESGDYTSKELSFLVSDKFGGLVATLFRLSVGIANLEELI